MGRLRGRTPPPGLRRALRRRPGALPPAVTASRRAQRPERLPLRRHGALLFGTPAARDVRPSTEGPHIHDLRLRPHLRQSRRRPDRRPRPMALDPRRRTPAPRREVLRRADLRPDAPRQARSPAPRPPESLAQRPRRKAGASCATESPTSTAASASRSQPSSKTSSPNSSASGSPNFGRTRRAPRSNSAPSDQSEPILSHRRTSESSWSACPTSPPPCTMPHRPSSARSSTPSASRSPTTSPAAASRSQPRSPSRSPRPSPTRRASRRRPLIAPSSLRGT